MACWYALHQRFVNLAEDKTYRGISDRRSKRTEAQSATAGWWRWWWWWVQRLVLLTQDYPHPPSTHSRFCCTPPLTIATSSSSSSWLNRDFGSTTPSFYEPWSFGSIKRKLCWVHFVPPSLYVERQTFNLVAPKEYWLELLWSHTIKKQHHVQGDLKHMNF